MSKHARLSRLGQILGTLVDGNPWLIAVALIGFSVSFETIAGLARAHHLPGYPVLYPVLIDVGILAMIVESRKAIDARRSDLVPRLLAWALIALTLYVNVHGSAEHDWLGRSMHVVAPALWAALLELTRWRKLARRRREDDGIPRSRWIASPVRTWGMRRRMVLHNVTAYAEASAREDARLLAIDLAAAVYPKPWKRTAPALLRHHLRSGTLPAAVAQAAADGSLELPDAVEAWVTGAQSAGVRAAARARKEKAALDGQQSPAADGQPAPPPARHPKPSAAGGMSAKVKRALTVNPSLTTAEVTKKTGASESTVTRVRKELKAEGPSVHLVAKVGG